MRSSLTLRLIILGPFFTHNPNFDGGSDSETDLESQDDADNPSDDEADGTDLGKC
jgi:hypothetical protein